MKFIPSTFLLVALLLGACSTNIPPTEMVSPATTNVPQPSATPTKTVPTKTSTLGEVAHQAIITEIENTVSASTTISENLIPATQGMVILPGGIVETGSDGRVRIDLVPEGTIVRIGPNSSITISEITQTDGQPKTTLELLFGKVYILLNGGSLNVETPTGVASVQGSVLSVEYDPETKRVQASCLEGHCSLGNGGKNEVPLVMDEMSYMDYGAPPAPPEKVDRGEIQDWLDRIPEMPKFFNKLPKPGEYPPPPEKRRPILGNGAPLPNGDHGGTPRPPGGGRDPRPPGGDPRPPGGDNLPPGGSNPGG